MVGEGRGGMQEHGGGLSDTLSVECRKGCSQLNAAWACKLK